MTTFVHIVLMHMSVVRKMFGLALKDSLNASE